MSDDKDRSMLSSKEFHFIKKKVENYANELIIVQLNGFDGDSLSEVSEQRNLSLRFDS